MTVIGSLKTGPGKRTVTFHPAIRLATVGCDGAAEYDAPAVVLYADHLG